MSAVTHASSFLNRLVAKRWPHAEVRVELHPYDALYVVTAAFPEKDIRAADAETVMRRLATTVLPKDRERKSHPSRFWRKRR